MTIINWLGFILVIDAILSFYLPQDKQFFWQVGRGIRFLIGVYLFLLK